MSVLGEKTISATQHGLDLSQLKQVFPVKEYFNIVYIYFSSPSYGLYTAVPPTWDRHSSRSPFSGFLQHWPLDFPSRSSPWNRDGNCKQCLVHCRIWYGGGGGLQSFWDLGWGAGSKVLEVLRPWLRRGFGSFKGFESLVEGRFWNLKFLRAWLRAAFKVLKFLGPWLRRRFWRISLRNGDSFPHQLGFDEPVNRHIRFFYY